MSFEVLDVHFAEVGNDSDILGLPWNAKAAARDGTANTVRNFEPVERG